MGILPVLWVKLVRHTIRFFSIAHHVIMKFFIPSSLFFLCIFSTAIAQQAPIVKMPVFKKDTISIIQFGARADGSTLNTKSFTNAINRCNAKGGGVVLVPAGLWITGPFELKSNVNLHLQRNAMILFTSDKEQFPLVASNWEGLPAARNQSPISATNARNIAITGFGIIDGNGDAWRAVKKDKLPESQWKKLIASGGQLSDDKKQWYPSESYANGAATTKAGVLQDGKTLNDFKDIKDFLRPNLLVLTYCERVLLEGVTFQNSAAWCLHPLMTKHLTVRDVKVKNPWYAQNGDGIDVESCRYVLIENSTFDVGDDGLCMKSGRDEDGRKRAMPTEDVIIRNCTVYNSHGGFVIGSEMSGGVRNVFVSDCSFIGSDIGLRFKTTRGRGGIVENIFIKNINMKNIPGEAILFDMYYAAQDPVALVGEKREPPKVEFQPVTEATPIFRNISIKNVVCDGAAKAIFIRGLPEMNIRDISLENISITAQKGIECTEAQNIIFKNVTVQAIDATPLIDIQQSSKILFDHFSTKVSSPLMLRIGGERSGNITWKKSTTLSPAQVQKEFGAPENALNIQ